MVNQRGDLKVSDFRYRLAVLADSASRIDRGTGSKRHARLHEPAAIERRSRHTSRRHLLVRRDDLRIAHQQAAVLFGQHRPADLRASCSFNDGASERIRYRAGIHVPTDLARQRSRLVSLKHPSQPSAIGRTRLHNGCSLPQHRQRTSRRFTRNLQQKKLLLVGSHRSGVRSSCACWLVLH